MESYLINTIATYIIFIIILAMLKPNYLFVKTSLTFPIVSILIAIVVFFLYYYSHMISKYEIQRI